MIAININSSTGEILVENDRDMTDLDTKKIFCLNKEQALYYLSEIKRLQIEKRIAKVKADADIQFAELEKKVDELA